MARESRIAVNRMPEHRARAFAPGHLTAFFRIADTPEDPMCRGSLGSGICLTKGVYSTVTVSGGSIAPEKRSGIHVSINGREREAEVTAFALNRLLEEAVAKGWISRKVSSFLTIDVETILELPEKSGWGMSGAGALSAVLALREAMNFPLSFYETAFFAHLSELENSTGLGDVAAQCCGGVTIRKRPGLPPHGFVDTIPAPDLEVVCLSLPEPLTTSSVLGDPTKRKMIDSAGRVAVDGITWLPTMDMFFEYAKKFTRETGLASSGILEALTSIEGLGKGGMAMLGNSLFAVGDTERLVESLESYGRIDVCGIDFAGARVVNPD